MTKKRTRTVARKMYIYCEGEKTEPLYLKSYISDKNKNNGKVIEIAKNRKNTPEQLVDLAIEKRKSAPSGDVFWVVYDREELNEKSIKCHEKAWAKAKKNNINIAISCVCFEVWILMHYRYSAKEYATYNELLSSSPLKKLIPNYDKSNAKIYENHLKDKTNEAIINTTKLNDDAKKSHPGKKEYLYGSYTNFIDLLKNIDSF